MLRARLKTLRRVLIAAVLLGLLVCGAEDGITPPAEMRTIAAAIPGAEYVEVPSAGHMSPLENPAAVNQAMRNFLRA